MNCYCWRVGIEVLKRHLNYMKYVLTHKWYVFLECCNLNIPLLGIIHDWSRFRPSEWIPYANSAPYTKGNKPIAIANAFELAWNDHQHRNKHHWEYWVHFDYHNHEKSILPIPDRYRREMLADWRGAGAAKGTPDVRAWFESNKSLMQLHPDTVEWLEKQLVSGQ